MQSEERRSAVQRGMKWYRREVSPTLACGSNTSGRMCGRVVAGGLTAVDVLTAGESQMAAGGMFIEPQLPMTHLQAIAGEPSANAGNATNSVLAYGGRSVGGGRRLAKMNTLFSNSIESRRSTFLREREAHRRVSRSTRSKTRGE